MVEWIHDWMHGWVNALVGRLLVVAWAYGRLSHARGPTADRLTGFKPRQRPSRSTTNKKQRTHSSNHACNHPSNHTSVHSSTTHPSTHLIHSPTDPVTHPIHLFTPFIHQLMVAIEKVKWS